MRRKEKKLKELIREYLKEAAALEKRSKEIGKLISEERDVFKLHKLEQRKNLLDTERYEILRDIRDMSEAVYKEDKYAQAV